MQDFLYLCTRFCGQDGLFTDINQITQDQLAFKAQKDQPGGKKTMKAYYWKVCGDAYDEAHNG